MYFVLPAFFTCIKFAFKNKTCYNKKMPKSPECMHTIERKETIAPPEVTQHQLQEIEQQQLRSRAHHEAGNQQAKLDAYLADKGLEAALQQLVEEEKEQKRKQKIQEEIARLENIDTPIQPIYPEDYIPGHRPHKRHNQMDNKKSKKTPTKQTQKRPHPPFKAPVPRNPKKRHQKNNCLRKENTTHTTRNTRPYLWKTG